MAYQLNSGFLAVLRAVAFSFCTVALLGCSGSGRDGAVGDVPVRIVSLAPNITETVFALGLGEHVVGVSEFCSYPPQVSSLPKVGGFLNPNFEALLALSPDRVIIMDEHLAVKRFLEGNRIPYTAVDNRTIETILESFRRVARECGVGPRGDSLADALAARLVVPDTPEPLPTVLLCIGRTAPGCGRVEQAFFAGPGSFYTEVLRCAGGTNAIVDSLGQYPALSVEAIVRMRPDIVVDVVADTGSQTVHSIVGDWNDVLTLGGMQGAMVQCITGSHVTMPGPRLGRLLDDLGAIVSEYRATATAGAP